MYTFGHRLCLVLFTTAIFLQVWGCEEYEEPQNLDVAHEGDLSKEVRSAATYDYPGCRNRMMIGQLNVSGARCADANLLFEEWEVKDLFENAAAEPLRQFCVFEDKQNAQVTLEDKLDELNLKGESFHSIHRDCVVSAPQGQSLADQVGPTMNDIWKKQIGLVTQQRKGVWFRGRLLGWTSKKTRLAILDSAKTREESQIPQQKKGTSLHGYTLVNVAKDLVCPTNVPNYRSSNCVSEVTTQLALPFEKGTVVKPEEGGHVGTIGTAASAVYREVVAWQERKNITPHLVINLSLGWNSNYNSVYDPDSGLVARPASQAMIAALEYASCLGAIVVTAAGNEIDNIWQNGPLSPGSFEKRLAPGASTCRGKYQIADTPDIFPPRGDFYQTYRPLVYSVGAVDAQGRILGNSAPNGQPPLVAYGDHVNSNDRAEGDNQALTTPMTGTSMSAVLVSSTAAAVWHYRPGLKPYEVMEALFNHSDALSGGADYCLGHPNGCQAAVPQRKRVSMCKALSGVCASQAENCPSSPFVCEQWDGSTPVFDDIINWEADALPAHLKLAGIPPFSRNSMWKVWSYSQPGADVCPACLIRVTNNEAYIQTVNMVNVTNVQNATLTVMKADTLEQVHYSAGQSALETEMASGVVLQGIEVEANDTAVFSFEIGSEYYSSPVMVTSSLPVTLTP